MSDELSSGGFPSGEGSLHEGVPLEESEDGSPIQRDLGTSRVKDSEIGQRHPLLLAALQSGGSSIYRTPSRPLAPAASRRGPGPGRGRGLATAPRTREEKPGFGTFHNGAPSSAPGHFQGPGEGAEGKDTSIRIAVRNDRK